MALNVLQLVGSPTSDFFCELSELYARGCIEALGDAERYRFVIAHVAPDGTWRFPEVLSAEALAAAPRLSFSEAVGTIARLRIDVAIPQMFCRSGMTDMRALLDVMAIPYLGNRPQQMAIAADKAQTRAIVAAAGVAVPRAQLVRAGEEPQIAVPAVVKPNASDNSDGVSFVATQSEYAGALQSAFGHGDAVLVEAYVPLGREVRCGIVERDGELVCLPLEEYFVDTQTRPIRRPIDKIRRADAGLALAAKAESESWIVSADDPIVPAIWDAARLAYRGLGCRQYGLFDFRVDPAGRPWFLEAGLYCSFSPQSVVVTMMEAAGTPLERFFAEAIQAAIPRSVAS